MATCHQTSRVALARCRLMTTFSCAGYVDPPLEIWNADVLQARNNNAGRLLGFFFWCSNLIRKGSGGEWRSMSEKTQWKRRIAPGQRADGGERIGHMQLPTVVDWDRNNWLIHFYIYIAMIHVRLFQKQSLLESIIITITIS